MVLVLFSVQSLKISLKSCPGGVVPRVVIENPGSQGRIRWRLPGGKYGLAYGSGIARVAIPCMIAQVLSGVAAIRRDDVAARQRCLERYQTGRLEPTWKYMHASRLVKGGQFVVRQRIEELHPSAAPTAALIEVLEMVRVWRPHDRQIDLGAVHRFDEFQLVLVRFDAADVQQATAGVEAAPRRV